MFLRDLAYTGLGVVTAAGSAARETFNRLSARGQAVRPDDRTWAGTVDRVVTRDVPSAIGQALGLAVDGAVRGIEHARGVVERVPRAVDCAVERVCRYAGLPSARDVRLMRERLDRLTGQLDQIARHAQPAPPWEEPEGEPGS